MYSYDSGNIVTVQNLVKMVRAHIIGFRVAIDKERFARSPYDRVDRPVIPVCRNGYPASDIKSFEG